MRDRLIAFVKESLIKHIDKSCLLAENIADDLLANGVIVPPCKVGQMVWFVNNNLNEVCEATVTRIEYNLFTNPQEWVKVEYLSSIIGSQNYKSRIDLMIGKTVFLTREEAEAKLKGGEQE